jgi:hypothetical protein
MDWTQQNRKYMCRLLAVMGNPDKRQAATSHAASGGNMGAARFSDYLGQWPLEEPVLQDIIGHVQQVTLTSSKHD